MLNSNPHQIYKERLGEGFHQFLVLTTSAYGGSANREWLMKAQVAFKPMFMIVKYDPLGVFGVFCSVGTSSLRTLMRGSPWLRRYERRSLWSGVPRDSRVSVPGADESAVGEHTGGESGTNVARIINKPIAAAMAYGPDNETEKIF